MHEHTYCLRQNCINMYEKKTYAFGCLFKTSFCWVQVVKGSVIKIGQRTLIT